MLSIGEFARYLGVSVRMLRHYDALGLLVPVRVDPASGYRYYSAAQLARGNRLIALKELGFGLDQLRPMLDAELPAAELRGMLTLRRAQVAEQIAVDQARLAEIERRLRTIEGGTMSELDFVEKPLPEVRIAQLVGTVDEEKEIGPTIGPLFQRLAGALGAAGLPIGQPAVAWYRDTEHGMELAAGYPVTVAELPDALAAAGASLATLEPSARALTVLHRGGMEGIGATWQQLEHAVEERGERPTGLAREVYLHMPMDADPSTWITELQQPLA